MKVRECYPYRSRYKTEWEKKKQKIWRKLLKLMPEGINSLKIGIILMLIFSTLLLFEMFISY